ncbi:UDP-glucuronosyl/UDP-glucosyltransferase [Macleaya cordata]|uniref:UDP-glucuronosyl/UDP-glucosyltransferase n=1 Tax=Macleaya cordata TaxID=56857 RepID=A0A200RCE0_MACCD|nr:UDP-glucuronosyl/UDP-glucosyltransferase [Macleaya cordata]
MAANNYSLIKFNPTRSSSSSSSLHVVMFPWLAFGHIIPFVELSKCLAQRGHRISFLSTPKNLQRILPKIPSDLSHLINFVTLPLPQIYGLPQDAEATIDLPHDKIQYLKKAFDRLDSPFTDFLQTSFSSPTPPDWIVHDFAHHWLPPIASKFAVPCAFFSVFKASTLAFYGPPSVLMGEDGGSRSIPEHFTVPPKWVPFPSSDMVYRLYEAQKAFDDHLEDNASGVSDTYRLGSTISKTDAVFVRSCAEIESGEWFDLLQNEVYKKQVVQMGGLLSPPPPLIIQEAEDKKWVEMREWLDKQRQGSVVYVAFGSEATLSQEGMIELALGLESSELPFFWVIRSPHGSTQEDYLSSVLPAGFEDRTKGRGGFICKGWAPQDKILGHPSVGCFLTHCGWSSVLEALSVGKVLVLLPMLIDQGLVARLLHGRKIGLEIPRDERDGSFTRDSVTESLRVVMLDEDQSESFRTKAREMKEIFGDMERQKGYIDDLERFMIDYVDHHVKNNANFVSTPTNVTASHAASTFNSCQSLK